MEDGEVFDSSLLKECIHSLIANGKRNFAIDLTNLDYLYSDTINVLMALNKRALEVSGRLSLLSPQEDVLQILKRAGIHNILRIFDTEDDLLKTSEDIVLQTTSYNMGDIRNVQNNSGHQSEFDQLRNEIGSVFDSSAEAGRGQQEFVQQGYETSPSIDQEFDEAFQHFESDDGFENQGNQFGGQDQYADPYAQTPPPQYNNVPSGGQQFGNRQFVPTPPPPVSPKMPRQPAGMPQQAPSVDIGSRQETQRFAQAPVAPQNPSVKSSDRAPKDYMDDSFNPSSNFKTTKMDTFDDDEFGSDEHKKSKMPVLIAVIVVIALVGVGAFFALSGFKKPEPKPVAKVTEQPKPEIPQIPADTADTVKEVQAETPKEPVPEEPKTVVKKVASSRPASRPAASRSAPRKSTPRPAPAPKPAVEANEVAFTSVPSGVSIVLNGSTIGTTPFTWNKPFFGEISVIANKDGYESKRVKFEFTGGKQTQSVVLEEKVVVAPPPPPPPAPVVTPVPRPVPTPTPTPAPVQRRPEPELSMPAPVAAPAAKGNASIFIASIPPVADVYLDGKLIGKTNVTELIMPAGTHSLTFVKGPKELVKAITVKPGSNPSQMVRLP